MSTLLTLTVQGGVLILTIACVRALLGARFPRRAFVALWLIAALRLLLPVQIASPISVYGVVSGPARVESTAPTAVTARTPSADQAPRPALAAVEAKPGPAAHSREPDRDGGGRHPSPSPILILWLSGSALLAAYFLAAYVFLRIRFQAARPVAAGPARDWLARQRCARRVMLLQSPRAASPVTFGLFRPRIILPEPMQGDETNLPCILAHELTHVRRFDAPLKLPIIAALCAHWFNPLAWLLFALYNRDIELSCDERVIRDMDVDDRKRYAQLLLTMQVRQTELSPLTSGFSHHCIKERIVAIMKHQKISAPAVLLAFAMVLTLTCAFATSPVSATVEPTDPDQDWTHVLLLGCADEDDQAESDAILIASVNIRTGQLKLTSILGDMMIEVPDRGPQRIAKAAAIGGPQLTMQLIGDALNIPLTRYAMVDYAGLVRIIDGLGGVFLDVTDDEARAVNENIGPALRASGINQREYWADPDPHQLKTWGAHTLLTGPQAVTFARIRDIDSDARRARDVLRAMVERFGSEGPLTVLRRGTELLSSVHTNLPIAEALELATRVLSCKLERDAVMEWRIPGEETAKYETRDGVPGFHDVDFAALAARMDRYIHGAEPSGQAQDAAPPSVPTPAPTGDLGADRLNLTDEEHGLRASVVSVVDQMFREGAITGVPKQPLVNHLYNIAHVPLELQDGVSDGVLGQLEAAYERFRYVFRLYVLPDDDEIRYYYIGAMPKRYDGEAVERVIIRVPNGEKLPVVDPCRSVSVEYHDNESSGAANEPDHTPAPQGYDLVVDVSDQMVYAYAADSGGLVRSMVCSTGMPETPTPRGEFRDGTGPGARWHYFRALNRWAQYAFYIDGDILFHSVLFDRRGGEMEERGAGDLGRPASRGSVRLTVEDAQWIWEHCRAGTRIVVQD